MRQGQKVQSRVRHQRSVGRYKSPYRQRGEGTIVQSPQYPWGMRTPYQDQLFLQPWIYHRRMKGGKSQKVIYPWQIKGRKRIKRRRKQR